MQLVHVVAGNVLDHLAARPRQLAVRQGDAKPDQVVTGRAVAQAQGARKAGRQQAADGVPRSAHRVQGQVLAGFAELLVDLFERRPGLDRDHHVGLAGVEDVVQLARLEREVEALKRVAHAQEAAAADGHHGLAGRRRFTKQPGQVLGRARGFGAGGLKTVDGARPPHPTLPARRGGRILAVPSYHQVASLALPVRATRRASFFSGSGKILPGFSRPSGSSTRFTRCMASRSSGPKIQGMNAFFSIPMPCSPESVPPSSTTARSISSPAFSTWSMTPASRMSKRMFGCRLPSPAWNTLATGRR